MAQAAGVPLRTARGLRKGLVAEVRERLATPERQTFPKHLGRPRSLAAREQPPPVVEQVLEVRSIE